MAHDHTEVEKMMKEQDCTGDRVTSDGIQARIAAVDYQTVTLTGQKFMYCGIRMDNGFVVTGKPAACIDPANWRDEIGRKISYDNSFAEIWKLEAYRKMSRPSPEDIARVCHEVNRAYCAALGDDSQPPWDEAPAWQRSSAIIGVHFHMVNPDAGASASHESWMAEKVADGWVYGEKKDPKAKTHPCMVPFDQLPTEQQAKDYLFRAVVHAMK